MRYTLLALCLLLAACGTEPPTAPSVTVSCKETPAYSVNTTVSTDCTDDNSTRIRGEGAPEAEEE